jgi:wobble nucleotide-excising tRNase
VIDSITITSEASFTSPPITLTDLSLFNYFFGSNGTGKTTISRIIANESKFPSCKVDWKGRTKLESMVYNHDFVERNFYQPAELKGVFTLGEKQKNTLDKIAEAKKEVDDLTKKIETLHQGLKSSDGTTGKMVELLALEDDFTRKCWAQKQKYDAKFKSAFEGYRNNQEKFKNKVLQEQTSNTAMLLALPDLEKKAESVYAPTPTIEDLLPFVDPDKLLTHETAPILKKRVIGKEDIDIASMIKKLGNSDWVREGRTFYDVNEMLCPFCQQETSKAFAKSLNEYFDETFVTDSKVIDDLATNYATDATRIQQQISTIIALPSRLLDIEKLKTEKEILDAKIALNKQHITGKQREPSQVVDLESLSIVLSAIKSLIENANTQVVEHNQMVNNLATERTNLTGQVWRFVLEELRDELAGFQLKKDNLSKAIVSMKGQLQRAEEDKRKKENEIRDLEKQTTSIQPTMDGINALLSSFGFQGFKLAKAESGTSYKLVRSDGSDAKTTLSEGEKTFVSFLYFYHLLKGSESDSGMTSDRIVVFDDPVSSLDSDILFIVSSLIKGLFDEVRGRKGFIKQIFVLTHNVYFHREITFNCNRRNDKAIISEETFWHVRKSDLGSRVEKCDYNPIKTSYELLWEEVRTHNPSKLTIQNTLRRILENYFKILGRIDPDQICAKFEGKERFICKSLFSWVNDGSHFAHDDLYISIDSSLVKIYLRIFKDIFDKTGHHDHYKMMMGDAYTEEPEEIPASESQRIYQKPELI